MTRIDQEAFAVALESLYEAAAVPELWPSALDGLGRAAGGCGAVAAYEAPDAGSWLASSPGLVACVGAYMAENWHARNPRVSRGLKAHASGHPIVWDELIFDPGELDREPIQKQFFARYGLRCFFGFQMVPGHILLSVERGGHPMTTPELDVLRAYLPQFQRIGRLALARGFSMERGLLAALDAVEAAALLIDHKGHALHVTDRAERILPEIATLKKGQLQPLDAGASSAFNLMIRQAISSQAATDPNFTGLVSLRRETGRAVLAQALPLRGAAHDLFHRAKAIVLFSDLDNKPALNIDGLQRAFGLTPSEAHVASAVGQGDTIEEIALRRQLSQNTIRTHLKAIFAKTGTRRQGELVAVLGNLPR